MESLRTADEGMNTESHDLPVTNAEPSLCQKPGNVFIELLKI